MVGGMVQLLSAWRSKVLGLAGFLLEGHGT